MNTPEWHAVPPYADPPPSPLPPASEALLRRLNQRAEMLIATCPAVAEAIRRRRESAEAARSQP